LSLSTGILVKKGSKNKGFKEEQRVNI